MNNNNDLLTLAEVARIVGATTGTVARWCRQTGPGRKFPSARKMGRIGRGEWLVPRAEAEAARKDNRGRKTRCNEVQE